MSWLCRVSPRAQHRPAAFLLLLLVMCVAFHHVHLHNAQYSASRGFSKRTESELSSLGAEFAGTIAVPRMENWASGCLVPDTPTSRRLHHLNCWKPLLLSTSHGFPSCLGRRKLGIYPECSVAVPEGSGVRIVAPISPDVGWEGRAEVLGRLCQLSSSFSTMPEAGSLTALGPPGLPGGEASQDKGCWDSL